MKLILRYISLIIPASFYVAGMILAIKNIIKHRGLKNALSKINIHNMSYFDTLWIGCIGATEIIFLYIVIFGGLSAIIWAWS